MRHTAFALRRPVTVIMLFAAAAMIGLVALGRMPLEQFPDISLPSVLVQIPYPGSTPEEVEQQVIKPVEEALATLPGIQQIRSTATDKQAQIFVDFNWSAKIDAASFEVRSKLDGIRDQLPPAANRVIVQAFSSADQPVLTVRISAPQDLSDKYDMLLRNLKRPVERIDGVARVELAGVAPREIQILIEESGHAP